ncbi:hypothetical protein FNF28_03951 [Cafeteria roenbergensis]|uniref:Elongation factor 2 n=1 Tax=Cafeteria roenbergensis TaxID=33653 RepID=A0A5A8DFP9_CAFRO|nr:hypothetical protein FNF28_03951 [Cafeteria roenbergensis]
MMAQPSFRTQQQASAKNVSIIAHVDHGKSTLADSLVARAGLLSSKQAGTSRALDRDDLEQAHGVTIDAAVVTLDFPWFHPVIAPPADEDETDADADADADVDDGAASDSGSTGTPALAAGASEQATAALGSAVSDTARSAADAEADAEANAWAAAEAAASEAVFSALGMWQPAAAAAAEEAEAGAGAAASPRKASSPAAMHSIRLHVTGMPRVRPSRKAPPAGAKTEGDPKAAASASASTRLRALLLALVARPGADRVLSAALAALRQAAAQPSSRPEDDGAADADAGAAPVLSSWPASAGALAAALEAAAIVQPADPPAAGLGPSAPLAIRTRLHGNSRIEAEEPGALAALLSLWRGFCALDEGLAATGTPPVPEAAPATPPRGDAREAAAPAAVLQRSQRPLTLAWTDEASSHRPRALALELPRASARSRLDGLCAALAWTAEWRVYPTAHPASADHGAAADAAGAASSAGGSSAGSAGVGHGPLPRYVASLVLARPRTGLLTVHWAATDLDSHLAAAGIVALAAAPAGRAVAFASLRQAKEAVAAAAMDDSRTAPGPDTSPDADADADADAKPQARSGRTATATATATPPRHPAGLRLNVVDSPGHAQFGGEVAAALRASDGALLVVDVVEGPRSQTEAVLRQAVAARVRPVLVVNKTDRLQAELGLSPKEAARARIIPLIARINALLAEESARAAWLCPPVSLADGSVVVASGYMRWAFSARTLAAAAGRRAAREAIKASIKVAAHETAVAAANAGDCETAGPVPELDPAVKAAAAVQPSAAARAAEGDVLDAFRRSPAKALERFGLSHVWRLADAAEGCCSGDAAAAATVTRALRRSAPLASAAAASPAAAGAAGAGTSPAAASGAPAALLAAPVPKPPAAGTGRKDAVREVLGALMPVADCLLDACAAAVPSPLEAQPERVGCLFGDGDGSGWREDDPSAMAAAACAATGPLVAYITKLIDASSSSDRASGAGLLAVARIFSGTVRPGDTVWCCDDARAADAASPSAWRSGSVRSVLRLSGGAGLKLVPLTDGAQAGDVVAISGIAACVDVRGTLVGHAPAVLASGSSAAADAAAGPPMLRPLRPLQLPIEPLSAVGVRALTPSGSAALSSSQSRRLRAAVASLVRTDPLARARWLGAAASSAPGAATLELRGAGELHLQVCLSRLETRSGLTLLASPPAVPHRESVAAAPLTASGATELTGALPLVGLDASRVALGRASNGHVRLWIAAERLGADDVAALEDESQDPLPCEPQPAVAEAVKARLGWRRDAAARVWAAGPLADPAAVTTSRPTCLLIDSSSGVAHLPAIRDSVVRAFFEATASGPVAGQPMRGVVWRILDAAVHAETVHRSAAQVVPAAGRALRGAALLASPCLLEPTALLTVTVPADSAQHVYDFVAARAGTVEDVADDAASSRVTALLPVVQIAALDDLAEATSGRARVSLAPGGWRELPGDPCLAPSHGESDAAAAALAAGTASAGWDRVVRFAPPPPGRTAADAVPALRAQAGMSDAAPLPAAQVADAVGALRS